MLAEAAKQSGADDNQDHLSCEKLLDGLWDSLEKVAQSFHSADQALEDPVKLHQALKELLETLNSAQKTFQDISNARKPNTQAPNDSVLPRSDTLIYWYGTLEALQVCRKASVAAEAYFKPLTAKMIPAKAKNEAISVAKSIRDVSDRYYKDVRQNAQDWIDFLNRHGLGILKAWARWGATGEALKELLSDDDVAFYSQRALDSLTDSLGGILKVKMPK
jgi:exonuclease VII small subunit